MQLIPFGTSNSNKSMLSVASTKSSTSIRTGLSSNTGTLRSPTGSVISVIGIDPDIPLKHVLSQVRGGALERVSQTNDLIVLHFVDRKGALRFSNYAGQGHFTIEGCPIVPQKPVLGVRARGGDYDRLIEQGARRILKVKRNVYDHSSTRRLIHSRMNMPILEKLFCPYGTLLSVHPMICRDEVAFEIHFTNIASAIKAKRAFDRQDSVYTELNGWTLSYSKDPTERSCYVSL